MKDERASMRWVFKSREQVASFLINEFPEISPQRVLAAFDWAFFSGCYQPTDPKIVWAKRIRELQKESCGASLENALELSDLAKMQEIWHAHYPKTGGRDPADYILADWVKMGFEDLGAKVSFGISADPHHDSVEPSTRFGRVVRAALDWRRSPANWRRPTQTSANNIGPLT